MSVSISSKTQNVIQNKEYRCPKCSIIPFINIFTKENKLFMSTKCTNNHNYTKPFDGLKQILFQIILVLYAKKKIIKKILIFFIIAQIVIISIALNMEKHIN